METGSEQFASLYTQDFPGSFHRCTRCSEIFDGNTSEHVCPPSPGPKLTQDQINRRVEELSVEFSLNRWLNMKPGDKIMGEDNFELNLDTAIHRWEKSAQAMWDNELRRIEKQFSPTLLHKLAVEESNWLLQRTREMQDTEFALNDERRTKGMPYAQRMQLIDKVKITWCDKEQALLSKPFRVKPLREWFTQVDFWSAREMGMRWVIRTKFNSIVIYG